MTAKKISNEHPGSCFTWSEISYAEQKLIQYKQMAQQIHGRDSVAKKESDNFQKLNSD